MKYLARNQTLITLYHAARSKKSSLQRTLTRGLLVTDTLLGKHADQCLPTRMGRLKLLTGVHMPASVVASTQQFRTVHSQGDLQKKHRNVSSDSDRFSQKRCFSTPSSPSSSAKWDSKGLNFVENENEYFHSYLESVDHYRPYLLSFSSSRDTDALPCEAVATLLQEVREKPKVDTLLLLLAHWADAARREGCSVLSNRSFSQTVTLLHRNIKLFSAEEILQSIVYLNNLGFRQNMSTTEPRRNRIVLSKAFDQACAQNVEKMTVKELLLAADFFYSVRGSSFSEFNFLMCESVTRFLPTMTRPELILLLFHTSMARRTRVNVVQTALDHLRPHLNSLTLQELGIVNLAHYKTQSLVKHPEYFSALTALLKTEAGLQADPICLSAVLKYQHRSLNRRKEQLLPQFFSTVQGMEGPLLRRLPSELTSETVMRVLSLYYSLDLLSEDVFMAVVHRIGRGGIQDWRLKDVAKVVHILTNVPLGWESKGEALSSILGDLQRRRRGPELQAHPAHLLHIAVSLTFCGTYPHWLLARIFGSKAQKYFKASKTDYRQHLSHLSHSVSIEDSSYQGPLLQADRFPNLAKSKVYRKLADWGHGVKGAGGILESADGDVVLGSSLFHRDGTLLDLMEALWQARPHSTPVPAFLLPHFHTADVEILHRQKGTEEQGDSTSNGAHHQQDKNSAREAVVLHASNAYQTVRCGDGSTMPLLRQYHAMRARQLRAMGISVIEVPHFEFEASSDKRQYLLRKFQQEQEGANDKGLR